MKHLEQENAYSTDNCSIKNGIKAERHYFFNNLKEYLMWIRFLMNVKLKWDNQNQLYIFKKKKPPKTLLKILK